MQSIPITARPLHKPAPDRPAAAEDSVHGTPWATILGFQARAADNGICYIIRRLLL